MTQNIDHQREKWAAAVQTARTKAGLSQEELARRSGWSLSYIQKIENAVKGSAEIVAELLAVLESESPSKRKKAS